MNLPRLAFLVAALVLVLVAGGQEGAKNPAVSHATGQGSEVGGPHPGDADGSPNVVVIIADDLDQSVYRGSTLDSAWAPEGTSFANALVTTSSCCPSRASLFRGQYAHNTGLVSNLNEDPGGGARFFRESGLEKRTLATLLQGEGYETWFAGKYLNGYADAGGWEGEVPPGWDHWQAYLDETVIDRDGTVIGIEGHRTDWLTGEATRFIEDRRGSSRPFFMQVSAWETHTPFVIPERHRDATRTRMPRGRRLSTRPTFRTSRVGWPRNPPCGRKRSPGSTGSTARGCGVRSPSRT